MTLTSFKLPFKIHQETVKTIVDGLKENKCLVFSLKDVPNVATYSSHEFFYSNSLVERIVAYMKLVYIMVVIKVCYFATAYETLTTFNNDNIEYMNIQEYLQESKDTLTELITDELQDNLELANEEIIFRFLEEVFKKAVRRLNVGLYGIEDGDTFKKVNKVIEDSINEYRRTYSCTY